MSANQGRFRVATMARVLGVSPSGYYAWRQRPPSTRAQADAELTDRVRAIHARSRGTYGAPRIHAELAEDGVAVGRKRVARLMRTASIAGVSRRRGPRTTRRDVQARPAPDRVERHFEADEPNRLWVADITYIPTLAAGFLYLAIVLDVFSRRIIGWAMAAHQRTELVIEALEMAIEQRRPEAVVHHSDQGCQYTSLAFGARCRDPRVRVARPDDMVDARRGAGGRVPVRRRLVQHAAPPLCLGVRVAVGVRTSPCGSLLSTASGRWKSSRLP